ncbi:DNA glycosylase family protein [Streptomyces rhizosphaericus]|uniref:hypothetical protein n=1 Tax=Streptomyces rhizosphaericus TaxID=114699 RepID=UPI00117E9A46|nr:hypothetical protein [Streptomyces rhizosphaericus]
MTAASLSTDHPGWTSIVSDRCYRPMSDGRGATWLVSWTGQAVDFAPLTGRASLPDLTYADPDELPQTAPRELTQTLSTLGTIVRVSNPSLWDAVFVSILRQRQTAPGASRELYRRLSTLHGVPCESPRGPLHFAPTAQTVLNLPDDAFGRTGAGFFQTALQSAAAAFVIHGDALTRPTGQELVTALMSIGQVGPWTAASAAADYTGDFALYPHHDAALRHCALRAAPDLTTPRDKKAFARQWSAWATTPPHRHTLTLATLAFGDHAPTSGTRTGTIAPPSRHSPTSPVSAS